MVNRDKYETLLEQKAFKQHCKYNTEPPQDCEHW